MPALQPKIAYLQDLMMVLAVQIQCNGDPKELPLVEVTVGAPGPGKVRIRHHTIGLSFLGV